MLGRFHVGTDKGQKIKIQVSEEFRSQLETEMEVDDPQKQRRLSRHQSLLWGLELRARSSSPRTLVNKRKLQHQRRSSPKSKT